MGGLVLVFEHSLRSAVVAMSLKPTGKKRKKEKGIVECVGQTNHGGYHLPCERPTGCSVPDNCLWFTGSLGVSGIWSWGSHLPAAVCRNLGTPLAPTVLARATFPWWWVGNCCPCQGPWVCWRPPRSKDPWMISDTEVPYFSVSKIKYSEIFGSRYIFEFLCVVFFVFFFYSSEKQFRKLCFNRGAVFCVFRSCSNCYGRKYATSSFADQDPSLNFPVHPTCSSMSTVLCLDPFSEKSKQLLYLLKY